MWDDLYRAIDTALTQQQYGELSVGVFVGLGAGLFCALMWLRVWRWMFALFGLRA